ncbi:MAG TPA: DinB family protein [Chitinophagaceae bacterium]|nr:DinB family protein [Chitinophagaceae bacterium]
MNEAITEELIATRARLAAVLEQFSADNFNTVPFTGSWTPGEVTEHVFKSLDGIPSLLTGDSLPTQRDPAAHVANLRSMFLDFSTKMKSPAFILPSAGQKDYSSLRKDVLEKMDAIIAVAPGIDATLTVAHFQFPGSGPVTRLELLHFISVHTQRHAHQLTEMAKRLAVVH